MLREIRQSSNARSHGGVNVEVLLRGAEKLCEVYTIAGASEKIRALRSRHREVAASVSMLEGKVSKQQALLSTTNPTTNPEEDGHDGLAREVVNSDTRPQYTEQDFQTEEDEIRELEAKKKVLEDRVSDMERDLGGLLK